MCMTLCQEVDITSAEMEPPNQRCKPYVEVIVLALGGRVVTLDYQVCREWQAIPLTSLVDSLNGLGNDLNARRGAMRQRFINQPDRTAEAMRKGCCKDNTQPDKLVNFLRRLAEAILGHGSLALVHRVYNDREHADAA